MIPHYTEIKPISNKVVNVELDKLHIRYIPIVTPIKLWNYDMSLANSPHVELMNIFKEHGCKWNLILNTRYFKEREHRHKIGMIKWSQKRIRLHIKRRYAIFKSIKKGGYSKSRSAKDPIKVLNVPFWKSRFGCKETFLKGMELWNGGGRAAVAYALDMKTLPVIMVKDRKAGTCDRGKFESKLWNVRGVWR